MKIHEITNGISIERLNEICEAERKNKLVILPDVNVGDTVYVPYHNDYGEHRVFSQTIDGYQVFDDNIARPCVETYDEGFVEIVEHYLSEEEAERVAKERADKAPKRNEPRTRGLISFSKELQEMYCEKLLEILNSSTVFPKISEQRQNEKIGKDFTIPLHYPR